MVLSSLKIQREVMPTKYTASFLNCLKRNDSQTFKSCDCKNFFFSVYVIVTTSFNKFFYSTLWLEDIVFYQSLLILIPWRLSNRHGFVLFKTSDLKEVCFFFVLARLWNQTSLRGSRWLSGQNQYPNTVINIGLLRLRTWQWPKVDCGPA